ncbi:uncharacterized protein LOC107837949 isoform X1 [Poecilia formosa]|uniref:uncharacterized protein LOC107837949 isoform X1 n=1 Tax=Poecilia formosa TaxID=48698 RepID=UPI0007BA6365|nr:PREDICTED: uncharacterized protein LOC107837949 isoform X1 [Poecilia formosa]
MEPGRRLLLRTRPSRRQCRFSERLLANRNSNQDGGSGGGGWSTSLLIAAAAIGAYTGLTSAYENIVLVSFLAVKNHKEMRRRRELELQRMNKNIDVLERLLEIRQEVFCSFIIPKFFREQLEEEIMHTADTLVLERDVKKDLEEIFRVDDNCASDFLSVVTGIEMSHGKQMWEKTGKWRRDLRKTIQEEGFENLLQDL